MTTAPSLLGQILGKARRAGQTYYRGNAASPHLLWQLSGVVDCHMQRSLNDHFVSLLYRFPNRLPEDNGNGMHEREALPSWAVAVETVQSADWIYL